MRSLVFVIKRFLWMVPTLLGVSVIPFCLTILIPGDPALLRLGNFATVDQLQQLHIEMGLDKPPLERYWLYLKGTGARWFGAIMADGGYRHQRSEGAFP